MSTISGFDHIKNKHTLNRGRKDCMKKYCKSLWKNAKKMIPLTKNKLKLHEDANANVIFAENIS